MKKLVLFVVMAVCHFTQAQTDSGVTLTVTCENFTSTQGKLSAALHTESTFMKAAPIATAELTADGKSNTLTFNNVAPGTYAILVLHDANDNQQMDYESNGMPKEAFGTSGKTMTMGPPQWNASKFEVGKSDQTIVIRL